MSSNIKRVVSYSDELGANQHFGFPPGDMSSSNPPPGQQTQRNNGTVVFESEMDTRTPFVLVHQQQADRGSLSTSSSLSDTIVAADDDPMIVDSPKKFRVTLSHVINQYRERIPEEVSDEDSRRANSQSSSRDCWGWYIDDVFASEHHSSISGARRRGSGSDHHNNNNNTTKQRRKNGLVPFAAMARDPNADAFGQLLRKTFDNESSAMAVSPPPYVLGESLSSQKLWKHTAGQRPPQPVEERAFYERMWAQNFARSNVNYQMPVEVLTIPSPICQSPFTDGNFDSTGQGNEFSSYSIAPVEKVSAKTDVAEAALVSRMKDPAITGPKTLGPHQCHKKLVVKSPGSGGDLTVLLHGNNAFGTTVSKSFARHSDHGGPIMDVDTVNISVESYRVVESKKHGKFAQFLVIYREGNIIDTVGVWKRYSDFVELGRKVTQAHEGCAAVIANISPLVAADDRDVEHLPNAITSWRLLKKHQRWYRCLDEGYLSLKVFLLERFLHDILFESSTPKLLREFVGADLDLSA